MEDEFGTLKRIVALLFSLAMRAEDAARAPQSVRAFVLMILRSSIPAGHKSLRDAALDFGALEPQIPQLIVHEGDDSAEDALRLAQHFRLLATILAGLVLMMETLLRNDDNSLRICRLEPDPASGLPRGTPLVRVVQDAQARGPPTGSQEIRFQRFYERSQARPVFRACSICGQTSSSFSM